MLTKKIVGISLCFGILIGGTLIKNTPVQAADSADFVTMSPSDILQKAQVIFPYIKKDSWEYRVLSEEARQNGVPESVIKDTEIGFKSLNQVIFNQLIAYPPKNRGQLGFETIPLGSVHQAAIYLDAYKAKELGYAFSTINSGVATAAAIATLLTSISVPTEQLRDLVYVILQFPTAHSGITGDHILLREYNNQESIKIMLKEVGGITPFRYMYDGIYNQMYSSPKIK